MKLLIIIIIAFLVLVYVSTYIKIKKRKQQGMIDTVSEFNRKYIKKNLPKQTATKIDPYTRYFTKYNSSIDYIERDKWNEINIK